MPQDKATAADTPGDKPAKTSANGTDDTSAYTTDDSTTQALDDFWRHVIYDMLLSSSATAKPATSADLEQNAPAQESTKFTCDKSESLGLLEQIYGTTTAISMFLDCTPLPVGYAKHDAEPGDLDQFRLSANISQKIVENNLRTLGAEPADGAIRPADCMPPTTAYTGDNDQKERKLIDEVSQVIGQANLDALGAEPPDSPIPILSSEFERQYMERFWHGDNELTDMMKYVQFNAIADMNNPDELMRSVMLLEAQVRANLLKAENGEPMDDKDRDRTRQMAENAALIKLGMAMHSDWKYPDGGDLLNGTTYGIVDLVAIAEKLGGNSLNLNQILAIAKEIAK